MSFIVQFCWVKLQNEWMQHSIFYQQCEFIQPYTLRYSSYHSEFHWSQLSIQYSNIGYITINADTPLFWLNFSMYLQLLPFLQQTVIHMGHVVYSDEATCIQNTFLTLVCSSKQDNPLQRSGWPLFKVRRQTDHVNCGKISKSVKVGP